MTPRALLASAFLPALVVLFGVLPGAARAQQVETRDRDIDITLGGTFQPRLSYGWTAGDGEDDERVGFGLRRARLKIDVGVGPRWGGVLQFETAAPEATVLDAYIYYQPNPHWRVRAGRMVSAQPRAFILTPAAVIDAVDRAAIANLWNAGTIGAAGRDFGLDLRYQTDQGEALLFLHNGDGSWDRARGNYRDELPGDVTGGIDRSPGEMAVSFYSALRPATVRGLDLGGYVSYNGSQNPNTVAAGQDHGRDYTSYAGHLYWGALPGSQPVRFKIDAIGVVYEETRRVPRQHTFGLSALGAVGVHRAAELFARIEHYDPDLNRDGSTSLFVTAGASVSPSRLRGQPYDRQRLTLGYSTRLPEDDNLPQQHLLVLQAQLNF